MSEQDEIEDDPEKILYTIENLEQFGYDLKYILESLGNLSISHMFVCFFLLLKYKYV